MRISQPQLRLIQVGVSGWGESWLERTVASSDWEVVAITNRSELGLHLARSRHGFTDDQCFSSLTEAAAAVEADAALIVSPGHLHLDTARQATDAGLHILMEKPLANDMETAQRIVKLAADSERTLMVSQNYRYRKAARAVSELIGAGWLGEVCYATVEFRKDIHYVLPDVPFGFSDYELVRDCSIHHFDQMRGLLHREPVRVTAAQSNPPWSWFAYPPVVDALIDLDNGGLVHYKGSWVSRGRQTSWDGDWYIECENGQIDFRNNTVRLRPEENWRSIQLDGYLERDGWLQAELNPNSPEDRAYCLTEFASAIRERRQPQTSGRDNLMSVALTHAVRDSAATSAARLIADYLE